MAIKEIKREWSPEQLGYVKHFLLHYESDVKDLPRCCVGSRATVSETDNEYVCSDCGWVRAEFTELAKICPDLLTDPSVEITYDAGTEVELNAFYNSADIIAAYFPNVHTIGGRAFGGCKELTHAIFPAAVTLVDRWNFQNCTVLSKIYFPALENIPYGAFQKTAIKEARFPKVKSLAAYNNMGMQFHSCAALEVAEFPALEVIEGSDVFNGCASLSALILRGGAAVALNSNRAFINSAIASGTGYIYVPSALIEDYKTATNWATYAAQFRAIEDYPEICDPDWDGHRGDVVIPSGKSLTLEAGATVNDPAGVLGGGGKIVFTCDEDLNYSCNVGYDDAYSLALNGAPIVLVNRYYSYTTTAKLQWGSYNKGYMLIDNYDDFGGQKQFNSDGTITDVSSGPS